MQDATWYYLDYEEEVATPVAQGTDFTAYRNGFYCAVVKYGLGYVVSASLKYSKE